VKKGGYPVVSWISVMSLRSVDELNWGLWEGKISWDFIVGCQAVG
jgi:hypothetical protein